MGTRMHVLMCMLVFDHNRAWHVLEWDVAAYKAGHQSLTSTQTTRVNAHVATSLLITTHACMLKAHGASHHTSVIMPMRTAMSAPTRTPLRACMHA